MPDDNKEAGKRAAETKSINDLFGTSDEPDDDPFNQLTEDGPVDAGDGEGKAVDVGLGVGDEESEDPFAGIGQGEAERPIVEEAHRLEQPDLPIQQNLEAEVDAVAGIERPGAEEVGAAENDHGGRSVLPPPLAAAEEDDPFAGIGSPEDQGAEDGEEAVEEQSITAMPELSSEEIQREKDYSDLLAEFEDDTEPITPMSQDPKADMEPGLFTSTTPRPFEPIGAAAPLPPTAQALFAADDSEFDDFLGERYNPTTPPDTESPAPELSIENSPPPEHPGDQSVHSLFSSASDWLDDTTMDDSFSLQGGEETDEPYPPLDAFEGSGTIGDAGEDVEVPEGWIDEYGNFQYYTEEDKMAVRESLIAERAGTQDQAKQGIPILPDTPHFPLSSYPSENAARRTPRPDDPAQSLLPSGDNTYAPPVFSRHSSGLPAQSSAMATAPKNDPYAVNAPSPYAPSSYTPAAQPTTFPAQIYDPYAPAPQPFAPSPYNVTSSSSSFNAPPIAASSASKPTPPKPTRVASNAYDPPFLRPQKSFIRPASAAVMSTPAFTPPLPSLTPAQPAPSAAPPPGPPRRTPSVPPAPPSSLGRIPQPIPSKSAYHPEPPQSVYTEPERSGYTPSALPPAPPREPPNRTPSQASLRKTTAPNAFDPPLRPPTVSRPNSRLAFSPPPPGPPIPAILSPPPTNAMLAPARPSSRGPPRKASPFFEPPPPARSRSSIAATYPQLPVEDTTPTQREEVADTSGVPKDAGWPHLNGPPEEEDVIYDDVAGNGNRLEDDDAEGGRVGWRDEVEEDRTEQPRGEIGYAAPASTYQQKGQVPDFPVPPRQTHSPQNPPRPDSQPSYDPYAPASTINQAASPMHGQPRSGHAETRSQTPPQPGSLTDYNKPSPSKARPPIPTAFTAPSQDPYAPSSLTGQPPQPPYHPQTSTSPATSQSIPVGQTPYLPNPYDPGIPAISVPSNPYGPQRALSPAQTSDFGTSPQDNNYFQSMHLDTSYVPQQVLEQRPLSEDPLGRATFAAKNIPLAVFGFGGLLVTAFPGSAEDSDTTGMGHNRTASYGYASGRGQLLIRPIGTVMEIPSLSNETHPFPGPLLLDPTNPKGSAGDKKKKDGVLAYLNNRAEEIERGLPYLKSSTSGAAARREEEGKLVLVRLLSAMVIGEGKLSGNAQVEEAMKKALSNPFSSQPLLSPTAGQFGSSLYPPTTSTNPSRPGATPAQLLALSDMLVQGDKRDAVEYAASHGLWSHALVIASSLGPEIWRETVNRFAKDELASGGVAGLRASYALFAGADGSIADELFLAANITDDPAKDQWREVIASLALNGRPGDMACLDDLAGKFLRRGLNNAAYACHILSPTSPFSDPASTAFDRPLAIVQDGRNTDAILFAEIAEYARGMLAVPKGQEVPFPGLPGLLPYKLQRAWQAAELGDVDLAKRYCHAVEAASKLVKTGPPLLSSHHLTSLEDLLERLIGSPSIEPAKGLSARKQPTKPGLNKIGSWIEGRLTKFIAGEDDSSASTSALKAIPIAKGAAAFGGVVGPFSHFSTISPAQSADVSRNGSVPDFVGGSAGSLGVPAFDGRGSGMPSPIGETPGQPAYGYQASWGDRDEGEDTTPHADDVGELINPMAAMSFGVPSTSTYVPKKPAMEVDDDEDDLGFGNSGLSRNKTPRPVDEGSTDGNASAGPSATVSEDPKSASAGKKKDESPVEASPSKQDAAKAQSGWFKGWFGKKEGDGPGPIRAKLGEENAMVFDKELKRWVMPGQKPEAAVSALPPLPRAQTVSPSKANRAPPGTSSTPPASQFATMPRSVSSSAAVSSNPEPTGRRPPPRSGLAESVTADQAPPAAAALSQPAPPPKPSVIGNGPPPPMSRPPTAPGGPPKAATPSLDDLLSRPSTKRPGSAAAKKGARNRYVDVFQQPGAEGGA